MATRWIPCTATMVLVLLTAVSGNLAQSRQIVGAAGPVPGISTDRLTPKQLRIWREIERIAEAEDKAGQPLHPTLFALWQWAKGGEHTITIDMTEVRGSNAAGKTTLGEPDRGGSNQTVIRKKAGVCPKVESDCAVPGYHGSRIEAQASQVT